MKREVKKAWVAELRSGKLPQTKGCLHRLKAEGIRYQPGYCCLGVLCTVMGLEEKTKDALSSEYSSGYFYFPEGATGSATIPDGFAGITGGQARKLAGMNDDEGFTFSQIADWIVKNIPVDKE